MDASAPLALPPSPPLDPLPPEPAAEWAGLHEADTPLRLIGWLQRQGWDLAPWPAGSCTDPVLLERLGSALRLGWWLNPGAAVPFWVFAASSAPTAAQAQKLATALARETGAAVVVQLLEGDARAALAVCQGAQSLGWAGDRAHLAPADQEVWGCLTTCRDATSLGLALLAQLSRRDVTQRFFRDVRAAWDRVRHAWTGPDADAVSDRDALTLSLLCRLMFLYFVQRKGWLAGDERYVARLVLPPGRRGVYNGWLRPLFTDALNTPVAARREPARWAGVPFLNGGLFAPSPTELRWPHADLPDAVLRALVEGIFERYRFVESEAELTRAGIDPVMLGAVFEELMAPGERSRSGTFYTPPALAESLVASIAEAWLTAALTTTGVAEPAAQVQSLMARLAARRSPGATGVPAPSAALSPDVAARLLTALDGLRIIDPACGSGAFLLAACHLLARLRAELAAAARRPQPLADHVRSVIEQQLHGIDLSETAVALAELRLWLALAAALPDGAPEDVQPLPNLAHRIRAGNALHQTVGGDARPDATLRTLRATQRRLAEALTGEHGQGKAGIERSLRLTERQILAHQLRTAAGEAVARADALAREADATNLFGERTGETSSARRARTAQLADAERWRELAERCERGEWTPAFDAGVSFGAATAAGGFDWVIGNPPWVRLADVGVEERARLRETYAWMRPGRSGPDAAPLFGEEAEFDISASASRPFGVQPDLSVAFAERSVQLCRPGGFVCLLLPAKLFRAAYGQAARRALCEQTQLLSLVDHSEDTQLHFGADTYPGSVLLRRSKPGEDNARLWLATAPAAPFEVDGAAFQRAGSGGAPWLLVAPGVQSLVARLRSAPALGLRLTPRMGLKTGANQVFVDPDPAVGPTVPLLLGRDIRSLRATPQHRLLLAHDLRSGAPLGAVDRATTIWLREHTHTLARRSDARTSLPPWAVFRVRPEALGHRVVWADIARSLTAAPLAPVCDGGAVVLNTAYSLATDDAETAGRLAVWLQTLPCRFLARVTAERALGGFRRYTSAVVAGLPLPEEVLTPRRGLGLRFARLAAEALDQPDRADWTSLDALAGRLCGLTGTEFAQLRYAAQTVGLR